MHTDRASVECFDLELQEWSFVTEMEKARSGLLLVALDHYLYAIGGRSRYTDFYYSTIERYSSLISSELLKYYNLLILEILLCVGVKKPPS